MQFLTRSSLLFISFCQGRLGLYSTLALGVWLFNHFHCLPVSFHHDFIISFGRSRQRSFYLILKGCWRGSAFSPNYPRKNSVLRGFFGCCTFVSKTGNEWRPVKGTDLCKQWKPCEPVCLDLSCIILLFCRIRPCKKIHNFLLMQF